MKKASKNQLISKIWACPFTNLWIRADSVKADWEKAKEEIKLRESIYQKLLFSIKVMIAVFPHKKLKIWELCFLTLNHFKATTDKIAIDKERFFNIKSC